MGENEMAAGRGDQLCGGVEYAGFCNEYFIVIIIGTAAGV